MSNETVGRTDLVFDIFKDHETNWVFKRTLEYMGVQAAEIGECLFTASKINEKKIETWMESWAELANRLEKEADVAIKNNHLVSARNLYLRASNYYRTAEYGTSPYHHRFHELWQKSRECFHKAAKLFNPPIQIIEVPFDGKKLPGYYWTSNSSEKRPTIFAVGGNDTSGEEVVMAIGFDAIQRGYNFFTFEFPGHRGTVHLYPDCIKRPDYEVPFKVAFDVLEKLPNVDNRIALTGLSFGGYVVTRVAIHESRVKAVIPNSPLSDLLNVSLEFWGGITKTNLKKKLDRMKKIVRYIPDSWLQKKLDKKYKKAPIRKVFKQYTDWTNGTLDKTIVEKLDLIDSYSAYQIANDLQKITCPALALVSKSEGTIMMKEAITFIEKISSEIKKIHIFSLESDGSDDHCQLDNRSRGNQIMFDWLDEIF
ncbi:MAG: alpha/beta hydrolase [Asgard group archaeon]|nr:alpha/beta hydrolase [Asgard group archaeon]